MHNRRLSLLDTDRSQKIHEPRKICPNGAPERQEGLLTDRLTIDFFRLEKDGTFFLFLFFFHTSAAALYLLSVQSERQFFFDAATRPLWRWKAVN